MRRQVIVWTLALGATLIPGAATAQSPDADEAPDHRARELYENGRILFDEGLYEDAIVAWEASWQLSERPLLLYNIASAQERLGQWSDAMDTLNRYRAFAPAEERPTLERRIRNLEARVAEQQALEPEPWAEPAPYAESASTDAVAAIERDEPYRWGWTAALLGTGVAGLSAGTVFAIQAADARNEALSLCVGAAPYTCPSESEAALDRDRLNSALADGAFAVGIVGTFSGLVSLSVGRAQMTATPSGLLLRGSF